MSRIRTKPIEPGTTIPLYIPKDIPTDVLEWLNREENQPLSTNLLRMVELKIRSGAQVLQGKPGEVQNMVEDLVNDKMQGFMDEVVKLIKSQGGSSQLIESTKDILEKKKQKLTRLGDL